MDAQYHGAKFAQLLGGSPDGVIERFDAKYHTNPRGQQYPYDHQGQHGFFVAAATRQVTACSPTGIPSTRTTVGT